MGGPGDQAPGAREFLRTQIAKVRDKREALKARKQAELADEVSKFTRWNAAEKIYPGAIAILRDVDVLLRTTEDPTARNILERIMRNAEELIE